MYSLVNSLRHIVCLRYVTAGKNMGGPPPFLFSKIFCVGISRSGRAYDHLIFHFFLLCFWLLIKYILRMRESWIDLSIF